ncbi:MAG: tetratricopeptide repeat protein [Leptospirales bacterium]|nr:tetratricopeptide repeat protein [Leptospirales bacterium]
MKLLRYFIGLFLALNICTAAIAQDGNNTESFASLKKEADDIKFQNSMEFYKLGKFDRALNEFNEYIEIFFDGVHRSEALKKIAEIYIRSFEYQKAIEAYRTLYKEFSNTEDGIDAYFQIGICYRKMGFDPKAEEIFRYIIAEHPGTSAAYNAEIQLELVKIILDQK